MINCKNVDLSPNDEKDWRCVRKQGSLLAAIEDVTKRSQLAGAAFHNMWRPWFRDDLVPQAVQHNGFAHLMIQLWHMGINS